ncbi:MAG: hypothetical protein ACRD3V_30315 [Vicinamibacteria bacterium]
MTWEQNLDESKAITAEFLPPEFAITSYVVIDGEGLIRGVFRGNDRKSLSRLESTLQDCIEELRPR